MNQDLFAKYDIPAPRYTSYPTVPFWDSTPNQETWINSIISDLSNPASNWSLYFHLPFCESLCKFCGCNNRITKDHAVEAPYLEALKAEWLIYLNHIPQLKTQPLRQIHLGGGSPTFFSAQHLADLLSFVTRELCFDSVHFEGAVEVDPRRVTEEQLRVLREFRFNRLSMGVQDMDPQVQQAINRIQPFELNVKVLSLARKLGYESINFDLIYGLPFQTETSIKETIKKVIELKPDRIALYSFAFVPWLKKHQKTLENKHLPSGSEKRHLYEVARESLLTAGYIDIGMDHFSLPNDGLALAAKNGTLHRNFMGYTDVKSTVLLGLGASSISESTGCFIQNIRDVSEYEKHMQSSSLPIFKGHTLTETDKLNKKQILDLMTSYRVKFANQNQKVEATQYLSAMMSDHLININENFLELTQEGKPFLRNACLFFDERLRKAQPEAQVFSKSI